MFLLIENGLTEKNTNIEIFDRQLRHKRTGMMQHRGGKQCFTLIIFLDLHLTNLLLKQLYPSGKGGKLIIDKFLDVLSMTLDSNHDIPAPLLNLIYI